jgi:S-adenosylmethionine hydrolase
MSFDSLLNQSATIRRLTGAVDRYGNVEKTYENDETIRVRVDHQNASEIEINAGSTTTTARIYTRYLDINAHDELVIDGVTWRIIGEPIVRQTASLFHHLEINAEQVTA